MTQDKLSQTDISRINNCDYYKMTKNIMAAREKYKDMKVGEVFFIKFKRNDSYRYVSNHKSDKDKFMIFYKDKNDFIFIKRVNTTGKLGVEVRCLTTQYSHPKYEIEADPNYIESIIFDNTENYDPLAAEKLITKKKGQARRKNKKIEINFRTKEQAYEYIKLMKVGDVIYSTSTSYGSNTTTWKVNAIDKKTTNLKLGRSPSSNIYENKYHYNCGFKETIVVNIKEVNGNKQRKLIFSNFNDSYTKYYSSKPYTLDDF